MEMTYAVVTTVVMAAQLEGREGSCRWLQGEVITEPYYVPPVLEWKLETW